MGIDFISGEVKFIALRVDDDADRAKNVFTLRLRGQTFHTAEAANFYGAGELPALRERESGADAGVGTGAESDGQAFDLFPLALGLPQNLFDQGDGFD